METKTARMLGTIKTSHCFADRVLVPDTQQMGLSWRPRRAKTAPFKSLEKLARESGESLEELLGPAVKIKFEK